ncbi:undecaprenyl-phosphate glucose phosphotransferase [Candidatus Berkelbacteria bacterium CG10_big_fil_rev_8_21_14_0_10_43_13]|uniref:Undecaprenyl-phosphate glucose phosphotransferase n=1 Tax=Candidatus Berkelbacteria bacterium CG10_big_fil_rev_8_21_14_0_10_43_13 TaxID=1974514 RepID=A0A2H0W7J0_9BACT|nr:MAG: undecaprenyl-phosphate glucose phosphotransferase [Candidatus Berkelbacteria bacterium CG10_big_fil_rev_8_21_14_0_10_43_13]
MKRSELFFSFVLLPLDVAMFVLAFITAFYLRAHIDLPLSAASDIKQYFLYSLFLLPVLIILFSINGLYSRRNYTGYWHELYSVLSSVSTTVLILIVVIFLSKSLFFSRLILAYTWILAVAFIALGRIILRSIEKYLLRYNVGVRNVILVGGNGMTAKIVSELENQTGQSFRIVGVVSTSKPNETKYDDLGKIADIAKIVKSNSVDEIVLTDVAIADTDLMKLIEVCESSRIDFKYVPDIFNVLTTNFQPSLIGTTYAMELKKTPLEGWGRISKRVFDFIIATLVLVILSPLFLIIAILVKLTSRGPIIYRQERVGRDETRFWLYKFRSMKLEKKATKIDAWTTAENEKRRTTLIGKFLRKTNLDELPQFWNILIGNMSFVGPRPEQPQFVDKFESEIPEYFRRHHVKSGLTGWAQVNGLKGDTSIKERIRYDIYYIENWSFWFDFKIIIKTIGLLVYETFFGKYEYRHRP